MLVAGSLYAQQDSKISNLKLELEKADNEQNKIDLLNQLAVEELHTNSGQARIHATEALKRALSLKYKKGIGQAYFELGSLSAEDQQLDSVVYYQEKAIEYFDWKKDAKEIAICLNELGIAYEYMGKYKYAIERYFRSLQLFESMGDEKGIANECTNIGLIYQYEKNYKKADRYFQRALHLSTKINYENGIANALNNIGTNYLEQGLYDEALPCYQKVLEFDLKSGNKQNIASTYNNIGMIYTAQKKYAEAWDYLTRAEKLKAEEKNYISLANTFNNMAELLINTKHFDEAKSYLDRSAALADKYSFKSSTLENLNNYYKLYHAQNNSAKALEYFQRYIVIKDSVSGAENSLMIANLQSQYDLEKANAELVVKSTQIESESRVIKIAVGAGILLIILSMVLYFNLRTKRKLYNSLREQQEEIMFTNELLKRKNEEVEKQKVKAEEAAKVKSEFLSMMSHEMRTPLNAIIGVSNLLIQDEPKDSQLENLDVLKLSSSQNMLVLINDVLNLSKLEEGKMEMEKIDFDLVKLMFSIQEMFLVKAHEKGVFLQTSIDKKIPHIVKGDPLRLNQVISNLVSNAVKFTDRGKVSIDVKEIESTPDFNRIEFSVSDTGIGIPKDKQSLIFESFIQAENSTTRKYGGTGLGLSISKKLLETVNSELTLESEMGKGSRFSFVLTFEKASAGERENVKKVIDVSKLRHKKVLIAEDNSVNAMVLRQFLARWEMENEFVINGEGTIEKMKSNNFDIILMDLHMPTMDGIQTASYIRNELKSNIPIIALTASQETGMKEKVMKAGMNDYVLKPFNPEELCEKMLSVLS